MSREFLVPQELIDKIDPVIGEPYRNSVSTGLADAIQFLTAEPFEEQNYTVADTKKIKQIAKIIENASLFTPFAKELQAGWKTLLEGMQASSDSPLDLRKKFLSFYLADQLLYQTSLLPSKKATVVNSETQDISLTRVGLASLFKLNPQEDPDSSYKKVAQAVETLKRAVDKTLEKKPKDLNTIIEQFGTIHTVLEASSSIVYQGWEHWFNTNTKTWVDQIGHKGDTLTANPYCLDLLLDGKLETINPILKFDVWYQPWISEKLVDGTKFLDYFLTNESLQSHFWLNDDILYSNEVQPIFDWIFKQDSDKIAAFFETLLFSEFKYNKVKLIQVLIGLYGISQSRFDDINREAVIKGICNVVEKAGLRSKLTTELDIIENRIPGLLYLEPEKFEAIVKFPRKDQTKEALLEEMQRRKIRVVYTSTAKWNPQKELKVAISNPQPEEINLTITSKRFMERWGEIGIIEGSHIKTVLNLINSNTQITEDEAFNTLAELDSRKNYSPETSYIIVPTLLNIDNPIYKLQKSGLLAIEQEGENVSFILDSVPLKIEADSKRLAILANLKDGELKIEHAPEDFINTNLYLLLNAAALLGRVPTVEGPISKDDLREIHTRMKYWNNNALKETRPMLFYERDRGNPEAWARRAPCLVGDKVAFLACY